MDEKTEAENALLKTKETLEEKEKVGKKNHIETTKQFNTLAIAHIFDKTTFTR